MGKNLMEELTQKVASLEKQNMHLGRAVVEIGTALNQIFTAVATVGLQSGFVAISKDGQVNSQPEQQPAPTTIPEDESQPSVEEVANTLVDMALAKQESEEAEQLDLDFKENVDVSALKLVPTGCCGGGSCEESKCEEK